MSAAVLEVRDVVKRFAPSDAPALEGVSITVSTGEIVGLIGPDGAGKTTLLRICAGLLGSDAGSVHALGIDVLAQPVIVQQQIGYMPQRFGLYEDLTVQENLDLYANLQAIPRRDRPARYQRLYRMTGLEPFADRLAGRLSGGMKQKLGLACALIKIPRLLLLDEPTVGVDPVSRRDLWAIVREMVKISGIGVFVSTAYLDEAERCDRVYVLNRGRLLDSGMPAHFHGMVANRVWEASAPAGRARELRLKAQQIDGVIDSSIDRGRVRIVTRDKRAPALPDSQLRSVTPRFEDAFMHLMHLHEGHNGLMVNHFSAAHGTSDDTVVEVRRLTKRFGKFIAVDGISFSVRRGEVFGLLGPNGAGKTTTFRMLCGLLPASGGTLRVAGRDLRHSPGHARARIGYMAQKFSLYGLLTVEENLRFFGKSYGLWGKALEQRIEEMLRRLDLADRRHEPADHLPGGYKQRLALAAALLHEPDVLFLDEPTSGVDPLARREFWSRITAEASSGVTVIVTTHFMEEAEYCDHLLILSRGRPLALGTPGEIRNMARDDQHPDPTIEDAFIKLAEEPQRKEVELA